MTDWKYACEDEKGHLLFNPNACEECFHEARSWEADMDWKNVLKQHKKSYKCTEYQNFRPHRQGWNSGWSLQFDKRLLKDPQIAKAKEREKKKKHNEFYYDRERAGIRRSLNRKFRSKMKEKLSKGDFHNPVPHEYKTYGWMSH